MIDTEVALKIIERMGQAGAEAVAKFREAIAAVVRKAVKQAAEWAAGELARQKRIARVIALIPQHLRGNPMCRDPWHRGSRA
ncbi:hypothetical protein [Sulfitobacter faviae]|uniref:hypothetical protein n=1 Tax=Sulfitobacter faviae TaxID=1775881 RepID=UPI00398D2682